MMSLGMAPLLLILLGLVFLPMLVALFVLWFGQKARKRG
jgi:hypothetical protein